MRNTLFSSITISSRSSLHRPPLNSFKRTFYTRTITQTPLTTRFINASKLTALLIALAGGSVYLSDTRAGVHAWLGVPLIRALASQDPEQSHTLAIRLLKFIGAHGLITDGGIDGDQLAVEVHLSTCAKKKKRERPYPTPTHTHTQETNLHSITTFTLSFLLGWGS